MKNKNLRRYEFFIIAFAIFFIVEMGVKIYKNYALTASEYQEKLKEEEADEENKEDKKEARKNPIISKFDDDEFGDVFRKKQKDNNLVICSEIIDLYCSKNEETNAIFSPTSFNHALGMAQIGASKELDTIIGDILNTNNYKGIARDYIKSLDEKKIDENNMIHIANAFWFDNSFKIKDSCEKELNKYYNAETHDFDKKDPQESASIINKWASDNTYGLIDNIVNENNILNSKTILTNAVYFNSEWENEWEVKIDEDGNEKVYPFYSSNQELVSYMDNYGEIYFENDYAKAFGCDYKIPGFSFIGILPKDEGPFTMESLDINGLLSSGKKYNGNLKISMPKLNYSTRFELDHLLGDLGYKDLFLYPTYVLKGKPQNIDSIVQKTKIELNEKYTRAAAVTSVDIFTSTYEPVKEISIVLNRPFAFLIYDNNNDEVLFMGKVLTTRMEN